MKQIINKLYGMNRTLISDDCVKTLNILSKEVDLRVIKIKSGTKCFTWKVPQKWQVEQATLTDKKTKKVILDYKKNPLYLWTGSLSYSGEVSYSDLKNHIKYHKKNRTVVPYVYKFYERDWGFSMSLNQFQKLNKSGKFIVDIKTTYSNSELLIGEVTIKGRTLNEIILIAHYDHPFQANDNLSGVAVALEVAKKLKNKKLNHTIKILFLPETIGSIAYVWKRLREIKNIEYVVVLDMVGNENRLLFQKSFDRTHHINYFTENILGKMNLDYERAEFREKMGSDELVFSDPQFGIPAICFSTYPYPEYHTHLDTPEIISEKMLEKVEKLCLTWIKEIDKNFIPRKNWKGPLMRSKIGWFIGDLLEDRKLEYFGYNIDGKRSVIEIAQSISMDSDLALDFAHDLKKKGYLR